MAIGSSGSMGVDRKTTKVDNNVSSIELSAAQRKAERLEAELAALRAEQQQEQQRIDSDTQVPLIKSYLRPLMTDAAALQAEQQTISLSLRFVLMEPLFHFNRMVVLNGKGLFLRGVSHLLLKR